MPKQLSKISAKGYGNTLVWNTWSSAPFKMRSMGCNVSSSSTSQKRLSVLQWSMEVMPQMGPSSECCHRVFGHDPSMMNLHCYWSHSCPIQANIQTSDSA